MFGRKVRVRYLVGIAGLDETVDPGQVADVTPEEAESHIAAGRAELAPDAPLGGAPTAFAMVPCRVCGTPNSEFSTRCEVCGRFV